MGKDNIDMLRGLFEGGNFPNAQINILPGDGVHVSYESSKKEEGNEKVVGVRESLMDYVGRLMPVVSTGYRDQFTKIWQEILEQEAVSKVVYNKGSQKGTLFNRNLVANIIHYLDSRGLYKADSNDSTMAIALECNKDHSVRGALAKDPAADIVSRLDRYMETFTL